MLSPDLDVARRFVEQHAPPGRLLLCGVSGAHLYGFPSPDSDLDLKGIHLAPTDALLGLSPSTPAHDVTEVAEGVECDLTTNEVGSALALLLAGNGNMLERALSRWQLVISTDVDALQDLARGAISRRFARHYRGFFRGVTAEHERQPTVKSMLYSYRVALTGIHLLRTGRLEPDVTVLASERGWTDVDDLVRRKRDGHEHGAIPEALDEAHRQRWAGLADELSDAEATSLLPDEAPNRREVEAWLIARRRADLDG